MWTVSSSSSCCLLSNASASGSKAMGVPQKQCGLPGSTHAGWVLLPPPLHFLSVVVYVGQKPWGLPGCTNAGWFLLPHPLKFLKQWGLPGSTHAGWFLPHPPLQSLHVPVHVGRRRGWVGARRPGELLSANLKKYKYFEIIQIKKLNN